MKQWKRLTFYLLLNVAVSACTTLAVLFAWDRTHGSILGDLNPLALNTRAGSPAETPLATAPAETPVPEPTATPAFETYTVQPNDTLGNIAQRFGVQVEDILLANGFTDPNSLGVGENLLIPMPTQPAQEPGVEITSIAGVGDLSSERVLLKQTGDGELSLVGWQLMDEDGNVFIFPQFPQLTLFKGGAVNVMTGKGANTVVDLYWGLEEPVWQHGEKAVLLDAEGNEQASYNVP